MGCAQYAVDVHSTVCTVHGRARLCTHVVHGEPYSRVHACGNQLAARSRGEGEEREDNGKKSGGERR